MDATGLGMSALFKAVLPFILSMLVSLFIISVIPELSTWLPKVLGLY